MLDYEEVKRFYANKLAQDVAGHGRMESAFFHTIRYAYERGLADGAAGRTLRLEEPGSDGSLFALDPHQGGTHRG